MTAELTRVAKVRGVVERLDALAATADLASVHSASFGFGYHIQNARVDPVLGRIDTIGWKNHSIWPVQLRAEFAQVLAQVESDVFEAGTEPSPLPQIFAERPDQAPRSFSGFLRYLPDATKRAEATLLHRATQYFITTGEVEDQQAMSSLAKSWARLVTSVPDGQRVPFLSEVFEQAFWRDFGAGEAEPPRGFFESPAGCELFRSMNDALFTEHRRLRLVHHEGFSSLMVRFFEAVRETCSRDLQS